MRKYRGKMPLSHPLSNTWRIVGDAGFKPLVGVASSHDIHAPLLNRLKPFELINRLIRGAKSRLLRVPPNYKILKPVLGEQ
jgi:hypothetical protein